MFHVYALRSQQKLLLLLGLLLRRPERRFPEFRRRVIHVPQPLHGNFMLTIHRRSFRHPERRVFVREILDLSRVGGLLFFDVFVRHPLLLRAQAVLLRRSLTHGD